MTFKHDKFEDSPVMRSLEKVAHQKGWVESKPITKSANQKVNLKPSSNLTENILKLCNGLRDAGLEKFAADLENKFVAFKQGTATHLYNATGEKGEDLIDAAHPKGSHKMEDLDGAEFKTILDKHLDMVNMVNKKPTGKLTTANEILGAVRTVLGGSFLNNGGATTVRKIAQDTQPESSNIGGEVAGGVAGLAGLAGLKFIFNKLKAAKALDSQVVKEVESQMARKLTNAEADVIRKELLKRVSSQAMEKTFGEQAAKKLSQEAGKVITQQVEKGVAQQAGKSVSSGLWNRVLSFVGRGGATAAEGAATEGAAVAGGEGAAAVAGGAAVGTAATVAAIAASAIIGGIIGYKLFDHAFNAPEIIKAGENLLSDAESAGLTGKGAVALMKFKGAFSSVKSSGAEVTKINKSSNAEASIKSLKQYSDSLLEASDAAAQMMYFAREQFNEYNPLQVLPGWMSDTGAMRNVELQSANFINRVAETNGGINEMLRGIYADLDKKMQTQTVQQTKDKGGPASAELDKMFVDSLGRISKYKSIITAKKPANANALNKFLDEVGKFVRSEQAEFEGAKDNKEAVAKTYKDRMLSEVIPPLDKFESLYGK